MTVIDATVGPLRNRILFVDDEANILQGLQNLLRKQRKQWDMVFCLGAETALEELARGHFDVIVSDMRMPRMDGATLLQHVKDLYPTIVRIVLSGHAEREAVRRALPVSHQFLSKPCDPSMLRDTLGRACAMRDMLPDDDAQRMVGAVDTLPTPASLHDQLTAALARPDVSIIDIVAIIETDPAMSAKVLQLVNSAYFGLAQRTSSIPQAVQCLGLDLVKSLAATSQVFRPEARGSAAGGALERQQAASLARACAARGVVSDPARAEEAFTAALLHDVGEIVLARQLPEETRAQVGAYLLGVWGLPSSLVDAVAAHPQSHPQ